MRLGLLPFPSSGGISDPRRLDCPDPGTKELFRLSPSGVFSLITSILGVSGALIEGVLVFWNQQFFFLNTYNTNFN